MIDLSQGACAGMADETFAEDDIFYREPQRGRPTKTDPYAAAKALCSRCSIRDLCLQDALTEPVQWGFRAGLTPEQRQELNTGPGKVHRTKLTETEHNQRHGYYAQGWSDEAIAAAQGVNPSTIKGWRFSHQLPSHRQNYRHFTPAEVTLRMQLWEAGYSDRMISEQLNCGRTNIRKWRTKLGLPPNRVHVPRERVSA